MSQTDGIRGHMGHMTVGYALGICVAVAMLAGCGGSQPPIGAPGAMPQTSATAAHAERGKSWMLPEAKGETLLYVSNQVYDNVLVFSYPGRKQVGELSISGGPEGLCSDNSGNVFVPTDGASWDSNIYEYAHGGTTPVATLSDPGVAHGCAVDPTTGNLAVTNSLAMDYEEAGNIAVFQDAQGQATTYTDPNISYYAFCAYDESGNLFADGTNDTNLLDELKEGSSGLVEVLLNKKVHPLALQWNDDKLIVADGSSRHRGPQPIYQVQIEGPKAIVEGMTMLWSKGNRRAQGLQFVIQRGTIVSPDHTFTTKGRLEFWRYPEGGKPTKVIQPKDAPALLGVAISAASK